MQTLRTEHAARAAIADTLQARAAQLQAFRSIKPAPVRTVRRAPRHDARGLAWCLTFCAVVPALLLALAGCGGGDADEDNGTAAIPERPASAARI